MKIIKIEKEPGFYFKVEDKKITKITLINNKDKKITITKKLLDEYPEIDKALSKLLNVVSK